MPRKCLKTGGISFLFCLLALASCQTTSKPASKAKEDLCTQFNGSEMAIPYHIFIGKTLNGKERKTVDTAIAQTFAEIDATFNNANPLSEISSLNTAAANALIPLSVPLQDLLCFCGKLVSLTGGRFDPTVESLERIWTQSLDQKKIPESKDLQTVCEGLGWEHISIKNGIYRKNHSETSLDLRGIFKGLCIDWLAERIENLGYPDYFIEWGGLMRAKGRHPSIGNWIVQINPCILSQGKPFAPLPLCDRSIAMSGDYEPKGKTLPANCSPDGRQHHYLPIYDPIGAKPLETTPTSIASVIVQASSCALADALATAAMLFPNRQEAEKWAQEVVTLHPDVSFWILSQSEYPKLGTRAKRN